jgi:hypothetical protein
MQIAVGRGYMTPSISVVAGSMDSDELAYIIITYPVGAGKYKPACFLLLYLEHNYDVLQKN